MQMDDMILMSADGLTWECDRPYSDSTWPHAPEKRRTSLDGLPDEDVHEITWLNAVRHFRYDSLAHIPKQRCTVAALRAEVKHVYATPRAGGGGKKPSDTARGYATVGDIVQQMAHALSTPFDSTGGLR